MPLLRRAVLLLAHHKRCVGVSDLLARADEVVAREPIVSRACYRKREPKVSASTGNADTMMDESPFPSPFRWRSTHQSHVGPLCPVDSCREPLGTHVPQVTRTSAGIVLSVRVLSPRTHRLCFEVRA